MISSLSAEVATSFDLGDNHICPYGSIGWDHQFYTHARKITTAFVGSPGASFSSIVDGPVRNALTVGGGFSDTIGSKVQVGVRVYF